MLKQLEQDRLNEQIQLVNLILNLTRPTKAATEYVEQPL
jgi:hypothetical protein